HVVAASPTALTVAFSTPPTRSGALTAVVTTNGQSSGVAVGVGTVPLTHVAYLVNVPGDGSGTATGTASSDGNPFHGDLRYALDQAIADQQVDTITFSPAAFTTAAQKTITLNRSLTTAPVGFANPYGATAFIVGTSDNITIDGSLGASTPGITIDGGGQARLFVAEGGGTLQLQNLTLSGGSATGGEGGAGGNGGGGRGRGGAVLVDGSTFTADGCTFVNNHAQGGLGDIIDYLGPTIDSGGGGGGGLGVAGHRATPVNFVSGKANAGAGGGAGGN